MNSNNMPQDEKTLKAIDNQLKAQCKQLLNSDDLIAIAGEHNVSVSYVRANIAGERYNTEVIKTLQELCVAKIEQLAKWVEDIKATTLNNVNPQEIDN